MRVEIIGRDYNPSDKLKDVINRKVTKLEKYFDENASIRVVCKCERKDRYTMELTIKFDGMLARGEVTSDNMYDNIDLVLPKLERQLAKYKSKLSDRLRKGVEFEEEIIESLPAKQNKLVKTKTFELHPMDIEEAILQLELLQHDFFIFHNAENGRVNVLYKRGDGDYGLLDPQ